MPVSKPIRNPASAHARQRALEQERATDALASIVALQRQMRDRVREQPRWQLPQGRNERTA